MNRIELPQGPGSYRWYYVDATGGGFTAVAIFMIGSLFSARYAARARQGAEPRQHAAVNFALYERGVRRAWVLSEYPDVSADARTLRIGGSSLCYLGARGLRIDVAERTAPWGRPFEAHLTLEAEGPSVEPLELVSGLSHRWHPIAPMAKARLEVPSLGLSTEARAYHDGNHGRAPLGSDLRGWDWSRSCEAGRTVITYHPWDSAEALHVTVTAGEAHVRRAAKPAGPRERTAWGLDVPKGPSRLLESSPFYARLESAEGGRHALGEVADFRRFHSPWIRWMASLRTRVERAA